MNVINITAENKKPKEIIRLAAYCRVSSDSADQLHSFAAQIRYYKDYERKHPQYKLVDIYADEGLTGTCMDKRDELHRLIKDCKKDKVDRIIVKSVSRFARNTQELLTTLRMLKEFGVSVYFEEQDIDTDKLNMEMIVTFPGMAAQQESESISGNMRWSYKKRMESGEFNCCTPAYGFMLEDGQMVINEAEAAVIRRIFAIYLQGVGKQTIATILNRENIPRRYNQKKWYHSTIHYILNNERYMGDALLQKSYTTETLPFRKVKNNGAKTQYYVENANPAIVSREIYEAAQELQKARHTPSCKRQTAYPLTGMLRCPDCGRSFRRLLTAGTAYWVCSGKTSGDTDCANRRVREDAVYDAFLIMLEKLKDYRKPLLGTLIHDIEVMQSRTSENYGRIAEIDKTIADLAAQNLIITRLHTSGVLNASDYAAKSSEINNKISALRTERRKKLSEDEEDEQLDKLKELHEIIEEYEPVDEPDEEILSQTVESITVDSNAEITFKLIGGVELTEKIDEKGRCHSA